MGQDFLQTISQKTDLRQEQSLTPQQIQSLRVLTANALELQSVVEQELAQNPVIELEEPEYDQIIPEDVPAEKADRDRAGEDDDDEDTLKALLEYTAAGAAPQELILPPDPSDDAEQRRNEMFESLADRESMQEHLIAQLRLAAKDETEFRIGEAIIGSIDETGYLKTHPADIAMAECCSMDEVESLLKMIQTFDPPGIGARDLRECLILQIAPEDPDAEDLRRLITDHLEDIGKMRLSAMCESMELPPEAIEKLIAKIRKFNPFPGGSVEQEPPQYIHVDAEIVPDGDEFKVIVSEREIPRIRISEYYLEMLEHPETQKETREYLKEKIRNARTLMESLEKRKSTIARIAELIASEQFDFLKNGIEFLKPMTMKLIADKLGLNESTVSRAVSGKFVRTPQGVFEFKFFFSNGFQSDDGSALSSRSVKELIRELIDDEDPRKPLSDSSLTTALTERGIEIRRRTVAKYREELGIPASHLRKAIS